MVAPRDRRLPAGFNHDRLVRLDQQRGSRHRVIDAELSAAEDRRVVPRVDGKEPRPGSRGRQRFAGWLTLELRQGLATAHRLDRHRGDDQRLVVIDKAEAGLVGRFE